MVSESRPYKPNLNLDGSEDDYKLVYYDCRGIGEPIRYIFAYAKQPFQDIRIPFDYIEVKTTDRGRVVCHGLPPEWVSQVPYGKLPMLELGDQKLVYSKPICRFLACKFGLAAPDLFDDSKCDEYMDSLRDYMDQWRSVYLCQNEDEKQKAIAALKATIVPKYLGRFNSIIEANNGKNLVSHKITWADIYLAQAMEQTQLLFKIDLLKDFPALKNLVDGVFAEPGIAEWRSRRPETII